MTKDNLIYVVTHHLKGPMYASVYYSKCVDYCEEIFDAGKAYYWDYTIMEFFNNVKSGQLHRTHRGWEKDR